MFSIFKRFRRKRILSSDIPPAWLNVLNRNVWQYRFLHEDHKKRIVDAVKIMYHEKTWEGVDGLKVTPEMKATISAAASMLTLGLDEPYYFDRVRSIIIHPKTIQNELIQNGMVVDRDNVNFDGQAWQGGPVVFAWPAVIAGTRQGGDGRNVVIHEFAHHIDGLDGNMGGMPIITSAELRKKWEYVFERDFKQLVDDIHNGRPPAINPYAGTSPAEFFAVSSEIFFDSPEFLNQQLPDVYNCLAEFYRLDPLLYE